MSRAYYDSHYGKFNSKIEETIRRETYGLDFGQNSWVTSDEFNEFMEWLELKPDSLVLDVASGSGGPALHLARIAGCHIIGLEINQQGVSTAVALAKASGMEGQADFRQGDASQTLPFHEGTFDAITCIDAINHLPDRDRILAEWRRVLKQSGRVVFTDPVIVTGHLSSDEVAVRTGIGFFLLSTPGENERLLREAGFQLVKKKNLTRNVATVAKRWHDARAKFRSELAARDGEDEFEREQLFYRIAHKVAVEGRLSRFAFLARNLAHER